MTNLNKLQNQINKALRNIGLRDSVLESIGKSRNYKSLVSDFEDALVKQLEAIVDDGLLDGIKARIGKSDDDIYTDKDDLEIDDEVQEKVRQHPVGDFISDVLISAYLLWVFNKGGQSFLDKQNIPSSFDLKDPDIISTIESKPVTLFQGVDETTSKWISDQISAGKTAGVSNDDLVGQILDNVPDFAKYRAQRIVRTETAKMVGESEHVTALKNGAGTKSWQTCDDDRVSDECMANEDEGTIGVDRAFVSGATYPPQHPNCRCVVDYYFAPFQGTVWYGQ